MVRKLATAGAALVSLWSALPAGGAGLLADAFDYVDGSLVSVSGGAWTTHSGTTGQVQAVAGVAVLSGGNTEDVSAQLQGQPYPPTTNVLLYASFTLRFSALPSGPGDYFAHFKGAGTSGFVAKIFADTNGAPAGCFRVGISRSASAPSAILNTNLSLNTDYLLVSRYAPSNAASTLWLNPAAETDPGAVATDAGTTVTVTSFALREGGGIGTLALDNLRVGSSFADVLPNSPPQILGQPQSLTVPEGANASFTVAAGGSSPLSYQWRLNGTELGGATDSILNLNSVTTNQAGAYTVTLTNEAGSTTSAPALLTVRPRLAVPPAFSILQYNVGGNGATNWSTNAPQVQAIGRQLMYLQPDLVTFNEVPYTNTWQMTNWIAAFLPGYQLATNSGTDGFIRSVIASRFPITRSRSWLDGVSLVPFGYSGTFTRDLFEAQVAVPNFPQPLHVFVTHLKATTSNPQSDADRRAAEASAISNFLVNVFLPTNALHPYLLSGDLNEDVFRPETNRYTSGQPIQRLTARATGLQLTTPLNPITQSDLTESIRGTLDVRFDYILPCGLLFSNLAGGEVFRTDLLTNPPPPSLLTNDDRTASDHLPVLMVFGNPYDAPFRLLSFTRANQTASWSWESVPGQSYSLIASSNLTAWTVLAHSLPATGATLSFTTNVSDPAQFFRVRRE